MNVIQMSSYIHRLIEISLSRISPMLFGFPLGRRKRTPAAWRSRRRNVFWSAAGGWLVMDPPEPWKNHVGSTHIYPPVIKHGNGKYRIKVIFLIKPPFLVDFQLPRLITGGYREFLLTALLGMIIDFES